MVGHQGDRIREYAGDGCEFVENPRHAETNSLYSLWLTRDWGKGPLVVLNSDVLAHPTIYARMCRGLGNAIAYDGRSGGEPEHMKVTLRGHDLVDVGKAIPRERSHGESIGMLRFDEAGAEKLYAIAHALISAGRIGDWAPAALALLVRSVPVLAIPVNGLPWIEIDFEEDLREANDRVWPEIEAGVAEARPARVPERSASFVQGGVR